MIMRTHPNLALFASQFALGLMQVIFMFYYVKVFLNIFNVNEFWFNIAQFLFMLWNAINDPLFGYLQVINLFFSYLNTGCRRNLDDESSKNIHVFWTVNDYIFFVVMVSMGRG